MPTRGVRSRIEQRLDHLDVAVATGLQKRSYTVMVRRVNRGSRRNQCLHHFRVGAEGRPQQRGGAISGGCIYIRVLLDQLTDGSQVISPGGIRHGAGTDVGSSL